MKWLTFEVQRSSGIRFNITDFIFIIATVFLSLFIYDKTSIASLAIIPLYLVFSFFLFCNIFRIGHKLEIFWYIPFTILALFCLYILNLDFFWSGVLYILEPLKWLLILYKIINGPYFGIFSSQQ